jgi:hypothetical protein
MIGNITSDATSQKNYSSSLVTVIQDSSTKSQKDEALNALSEFTPKNLSKDYALELIKDFSNETSTQFNEELISVMDLLNFDSKETKKFTDKIMLLKDNNKNEVIDILDKYSNDINNFIPENTTLLAKNSLDEIFNNEENYKSISFSI